MQLEDWLDDLCVRFIVNLPPEELASVERICFQVEEAQWFYEDFIRPLDPSLPSLSLKSFSLRIFQHCPLFSTWSTQHYTSAFAEFLAYKQRVPVRGAIMLNEEMDEVVLVKGWKKGANWSFPRGKINKDENDLDCAIREVYEETGYDIQSAGLVKPEKDTKYIEVTMREQHMRLYVFRGVPKDTHFEPKTRKEISKVEWYKLTDLPTLKKKHAHHDAQDESHPLNANKFYMVAPFLHPLKKWIAQQKKKENRYSSSHLAAPPMMMDESATEGEPGPAAHMGYQPTVLSPYVPSSLPEVAHVSHYSMQDPSSHLKELLNIGTTPQSAVPPVQSAHASTADATKSNALLAFLRGAPPTEMRASPQTPFEQMAVPPQAPRSPQKPMTAPVPSIDVRQPPPAFPLPQTKLPNQQRSLLDLFANASIQKPKDIAHSGPSDVELPAQSAVLQPPAPYQRTGDPQFARDSPEDTASQVVPPANALPKLTHHTRTLLDAFKVSSPTPSQPSTSTQTVDQASLAPTKQALLNVFKSPTPTPQPKSTMNSNQVGSKVSVPAADPQTQRTTQKPQASPAQVQSSNASSLLGLFKTQMEPTSGIKTKVPEQPQLPVELAAGPTISPRPQETKPQEEPLSILMRKDAPKRAPQAIKAGETAATLDGPMNQPHFEGISKSPSQISADSMYRSPVPAHRTLYDPKQPAPTKILQRSDENKKVQAKSPRPPKANLTVASPKQKSRARSEKPFQPQILKRPQVSDNQDGNTSSPTLLATVDNVRRAPSPAPLSITASPDPVKVSSPLPPSPVAMTRRASQQTESQKQSLLSLLTGQTGLAGPSKTTRQIPVSGAVSPLTQSQVVSPVAEEPPISTRSRMSSLASMTSPSLPSHENRPKAEKRQTTAGDKAFLLGYLGRIASQEGHPQ